MFSAAYRLVYYKGLLCGVKRLKHSLQKLIEIETDPAKLFYQKCTFTKRSTLPSVLMMAASDLCMQNHNHK